MPEFLSRFQQQFQEFWQNLDKSQKNRLYITGVISALVVIAGIYFITRTTYVPLISNADTKEIKEMTKILDDKKLKYQLADSGASILIDQRSNNQAQAALIQGGYPKSSGVTFEDAFKLIKITTTESEKRKIWQREEESNISAKLKALDSNIKDAWVSLALPEPSVFIGDKSKQKPTASVTVTPKTELTPKQVQGIVMMVARSVENLSPKDVTVIDNKLNILNSDTGDEYIDRTNNQYEMTLKKKSELEKNILNLLNLQSDNYDNIRVVVNPVLDFNKEESQKQDISRPNGMDTGALISTQETKENLVNGAQGGAPGIDTNPGTTNAPSYPTGTGNNSTYNKSSITQNYDYTRTATKVEKALGNLIPDQTTAAVILGYGRRVTDEAKLSQEFIDQVKDITSKATGIPANNITVSKFKIAPTETTQTQMSDRIRQFINDYGMFAIMLLLIIGLAIAAIPRRKKVEEPEPALDEVAATATATVGPRFIVPDTPSENLPEIELEERSEVKKQIDKFVKQKPEAVAQLLRNWLSDEWD